VNTENTEMHKGNIHRTVENIIWERSKENGEDDLYSIIYETILRDNQTEKEIEDFSEAMRIAYERSVKTKKARKEPQINKSVPWWTHELTAAWKITNYLRRKYHRTRENEEQREITKRHTSLKRQNTRRQ